MVSRLTGVEALLLAGAGAALGALLAARFGRWPSPSARLSGMTAVALAASALVVAPVTAWAIVSDIRTAKQLSTRQAERLGPEENGLDTSLVDRVALVIPPEATYDVAFSDRLDPDRASVFRIWSLTALLPRRAVSDPASADWIVSWGVPPSELDVRVTDVRVIEPAVQTDPPVYVGRVVR
jgi:hypothetical protein